MSGTGPCLIIAEAGVNHDGATDGALALVDAAAAAGADAVKFQSWRTELLVRDDAPQAAYQTRNAPAASQADMLRALELSPEAHHAIAAHCASVGITFLSTAFDRPSLELLLELGVPRLKVASGELTNGPMLLRMARTGLPLIVSTGMASREEIAVAVAAAERAGCEQLALLWCTSAYPAPPQASRLAGIPDLRASTGREVGLSDHTLGTAVAVAAVALGATIIEKHVTLDHDLPTVDGEFSLDPAGLAALVRDTRTAWSAIGEVAYGPSDAEVDSLRFRRGLYFVRDLSAGQTVTDADVRSLRPSAALPPDAIAGVVGRRLTEDVARGDEVTLSVLQ